MHEFSKLLNGYNNLCRQIICKQHKRKIMHAEVMLLLWNRSHIQNPQRQSSEGTGKMQVNSWMSRKRNPG